MSQLLGLKSIMMQHTGLHKWMGQRLLFTTHLSLNSLANVQKEVGKKNSQKKRPYKVLQSQNDDSSAKQTH